MKNIDVVESFLKKKDAVGSNLYPDGDKLVNYSTTLAQWHDNYHLIVNETKYSRSTSKIQTWLYGALASSNKGIVIKEVNNIPMGTKNLEQYTNWYVIN